MHAVCRFSFLAVPICYMKLGNVRVLFMHFGYDPFLLFFPLTIFGGGPKGPRSTGWEGRAIFDCFYTPVF